MIITRTPFRISFVGGGSDFADYYREYGGAVISTSIQKYIYLSMHPLFLKDNYLIKYSSVEKVSHIDEIKHPIIREVFRMYGIHGVDFNSSSDIPSGTGLASSSAFTSGLITLCNSYTEKYMTQERIAELACYVEIELLKEPIGKQDQYACACGGLNFIQFNPDENVTVLPIVLSKKDIEKLEQNLIMFYTGETRSAGNILEEQKQNIGSKKSHLHKIVALTKDLKEELLKGNIDSLGDILHMGWSYKKELASGITTPLIDEAYEKGIKNGALGGKVLGAGGGGFLLFYALAENQARLKESLSSLQEVPILFDSSGTTTIYHTYS